MTKATCPHGRFLVDNGDTLTVRIPNQKAVNFHHSKLSEAKAYRDSQCAEIGRSPNEPFNNKGNRLHTNPHSDKQYNMPVGYSYSTRTRNNPNGSIYTYDVLVAYKTVDGKQISKALSIGKKWSFEAAFIELAKFRGNL